MKKTLSKLSSTLQGGVRGGLLLLLLVASVSVIYASDTQVGGIWYDFDSSTKTASVTYRGSSYNSYYGEYSGSVTIPETVTYIGITYSVTSIGNYAFYSCSSLTSVTIPNSVTSIGELAFFECSALTSVTIPNSVTCIGSDAFLDCSSLTSITIPESVTSIGEDAFSRCSALTAIVVKAGNTTYDSRENCNAIIETTSNTLIAGCQKTIIPNSVTSIGNHAFYGCSSLTSVTIPNSVTSIGNFAFYSCSSLTSVTIPNSVTSIGNYAFCACSSLTSITIPNSVTSIGDYTFEGCSSLTSLVYNAHCFAYMPTSYSGAYTIPEGIEQIVGGAFRACSSLTSVTIPNSVTSIGGSAFNHCSSLTSITIPNSVTSIGVYAFRECSSLTSITIPNSVTSIERGAFSRCSSLASIAIPNSVTSIGSSAFSKCSSLTSVTIPNSVTSIENDAFEDCSSLDTLTCLAMTPPALGEDVFYGCDNPTLFVPCAALSDYQLHEQWGQFTTIECIASEEAETEEVVVESGTTTITITWPTESNADTYTIVIKKDGEVFCTLTFNAEGQLLNIAFAPGRNGNHPAQYAEQAGNGYRFTVTSLESGTKYGYNIDVKDASNKTIKSHTGEFTTQSTTAVDNITTNNANIQKIMRNGQLIIIRNGVEYNAVGQEVGN